MFAHNVGGGALRSAGAPRPGMSMTMLAHQGGWDELAFVVLPIALFAGLLAIANRRATRAQAERDSESGDDVP